MPGTIRKRGNSYQALISFTDPSTSPPRQIQYSATRPTLRAAESALAELITLRDSNRLTRHNESFAQLANKWLEQTVASNSYSPTSIRRYTDALLPTSRIITALGRVRVRDLTTRHIDDFNASSSHLSANTRLWEHNLIANILEQGRKWQWVDINVAKDARRAKRPKAHITLPSMDDLQRLLAAADSASLPYISPFVRLALATGARRGELCALQWRDVDFKSATVTIRRNVVYAGPKTGAVVKATKSDRERTITIDAGTLATIRTWHDRRQGECKLLTGKDIHPTAYVFSAAHDSRTIPGPWRADTAWQLVRAAAGLPNMRLHDCRHFAITMQLLAKVPLRTVSERAGHASPNITLGTYAQYVPGSDEEAAEIMGKLLNGQ